MNYIQFDFEVKNQGQSDQLVALLNEQGFEGFEEEDNFLKAFISENTFDKEAFEKIINFFDSLVFAQSTIENINWNQQWESSFKPIQVGEFIGVRANFHPSMKNVKHEIIITPKMSFGTGHHATTYLMLQQMQYVDFKNKAVLDFGTGTGILAIAAEKLGATKITAIDTDEWSINNAKENIENNRSSLIEIHKADCISLDNQFDVILANINLNIILNNLTEIVEVAAKNSVVLLSGFFKSDEAAIFNSLKKHGFTNMVSFQRNEWICIKCEKY